MDKVKILALTRLYRCAYPEGYHHTLLQAAIGKDDMIGLNAAHRWLSEKSIDDASFRDQRLLLRVISRYGSALREHAAYPRLVGMQRLLWTRSMMAVQEAKFSLQKIAAADIPILLIKGASRLASDESESRRRTSWDIDLVVPPEDMVSAFDILVGDQWQPSPGASPQSIRQSLPTMRSINLFRGNFGDIDLHRQPFHPGQGNHLEDEGLWSRAEMTVLTGVPVRIPRIEDQVAIAIAHGGLDGHVHSDWMVDCALLIQKQMFDWDELCRILEVRKVHPSAAIAFHYLSEKLGIDVPSHVLDYLRKLAIGNPFTLGMSIIQSRPKERAKIIGSVARACAKTIRKATAQKTLGKTRATPWLKVRALDSTGLRPGGGVVYRWSIPSPINGSDDRRTSKYVLTLDLLVDPTALPIHRRMEWEINTPTSHVCRARYRRWFRRRPKGLLLRLSGLIAEIPIGEELLFESRPCRQLRSYASAEEKARYGCVPFQVVSWRFKHLPNVAGDQPVVDQ